MNEDVLTMDEINKLVAALAEDKIYESRHNRIDWDSYCLEIANCVSKRSTCLRRKYGAVIVKDNIIISTGYNGSPKGEANCIDTGLCERERLKVPKGERYELCVAVHAEQNAIINADPVRMKDAKIYIVGHNADGTLASGKPCLLCNRMIKNAGISEVIYRDENDRVVKVLLAKTGYKESQETFDEFLSREHDLLLQNNDDTIKETAINFC